MIVYDGLARASGVMCVRAGGRGGKWCELEWEGFSGVNTFQFSLFLFLFLFFFFFRGLSFFVSYFHVIYCWRPLFFMGFFSSTFLHTPSCLILAHTCTYAHTCEGGGAVTMTRCSSCSRQAGWAEDVLHLCICILCLLLYISLSRSLFLSLLSPSRLGCLCGGSTQLLGKGFF